MWTGKLGDNAPGQLISAGRWLYYKPDPLPPSREVQPEDRLHETLSEVTFWLGQLSGISRMVDLSAVLYTSLLRKEAMESAEIEGADIDYNAPYSYATRAVEADSTPGRKDCNTDVTKNIDEGRTYEQALKMGIDTLNTGEELSIELLHRVHELLLTGVPEDLVDSVQLSVVHQVFGFGTYFVVGPSGDLFRV